MYKVRVNEEDLSPPLDESIEELVKQSRIDQIERDFRSIGSIIDTRQLIPIIDPPLHVRALTEEEHRIRNILRRNNRSDDEKSLSDGQPLKPIENDFQTVYADYKDEEMIWKTKSSDPKYLLRRKYDHPELHQFYESLSASEKRKFRALSFEAVIALSKKYRYEIGRMKSKYDEFGIFHSDANAHRAHCMYLMKLHNGITAHNIEDPILKLMMDKKKKDTQATMLTPMSLVAKKIDESLKTDNNKNNKSFVFNEDAISPVKKTANRSFRKSDSQHTIKGSSSNNVRNIASTLAIAKKIRNKKRVPYENEEKKNSANASKNQLTTENIEMLKWMKKQSSAHLDSSILPNVTPGNKSSETTPTNRKQSQLNNITFDDFSKLAQEYTSSKQKENQHQDDDSYSTELFSSQLSLSSNNDITAQSLSRSEDGSDDVYSFDRRNFAKKVVAIPPKIIKKKTLQSRLPAIPMAVLAEEPEVKNAAEVITQGDFSIDAMEFSTDVISLNDSNSQFSLFSKALFHNRPHHEAPSSAPVSFKPTISHIPLSKSKNFSVLGKNIDQLIVTRASTVKGFTNHFVSKDSDSVSEEKPGTLNSDPSINVETEHRIVKGNGLRDDNAINLTSKVLPTYARRKSIIIEPVEVKASNDERLQEIWTILELPHQIRLSFMRKYCSVTYASELTHAVDFQEKAAVLVCIKQLLSKLIVKYEEGFAIPPYNLSELVDQIEHRIPKKLIGRLSASYKLWNTAMNTIHEALPESTDDKSEYSEAIYDLQKSIDKLLCDVVDKAIEETQDDIYVGNLLCKEWITKINKL